MALKRLTQLIDALKEDEKDRQARGRPARRQPNEGRGGGSAGRRHPAAGRSLKLLRALQAEVNERTEAFAKAHPDLSKLTPQERAELDAIRTAQADLAALLEEVARRSRRPNRRPDGTADRFRPIYSPFLTAC